MEHVLTAKIPIAMLKSLDDLAAARGVSKGTLVRQALVLLFSQLADPLNRIAHITAAMREGQRLRCKTNWKTIRTQAAAGASLLSPEEEVQQARKRGM